MTRLESPEKISQAVPPTATGTAYWDGFFIVCWGSSRRDAS